MVNKHAGLAAQNVFVNAANALKCEGEKPHLVHYVEWVWMKNTFPLSSLRRLRKYSNGKLQECI